MLDDFSLAIRQCAFVGIVGPSGAGKTTLLRAILGAVPHSVFTPAVLQATYGAEMVVLRQGDLTVIADKLGVFRDIPDQHSHLDGADHHPSMVGEQARG